MFFFLINVENDKNATGGLIINLGLRIEILTRILHINQREVLIFPMTLFIFLPFTKMGVGDSGAMGFLLQFSRFASVDHPDHPK